MTTPQERSVPKPVFTDAEAGAKVFPDSDSRRYNYFTPAKRKQSHYEDVTVEVQPDPRGPGLAVRVLRRHGGYPLDWTVLKAWGSDRPSRALARFRRQGLRLAGHRLAPVAR